MSHLPLLLLAVVPPELVQRYTLDVVAAPFKANMKAWDNYTLRCRTRGTFILATITFYITIGEFDTSSI